MDEMDDSPSVVGRDVDMLSSTHTEDNHHWCFAQVKGSHDGEIQDADVISCVEFDDSGELLATGDKGGRVVIFRREKTRDPDTGRYRCEYSVYSTFQSHEPEFDYLKSLEIEEKINKIKWLPKSNSRCGFLLSTNDKTVKLWRMLERDKRPDGFNICSSDVTEAQTNGITAPATGSLKRLCVPHYVSTDLVVEASPRRVFANAHTYHINSISVSSDQATFLSADDLRVNLWHLECTSQSFNVVDIKPANMEDLTEVITSSEFHPDRCSVFIYSSSKGTIRLCDMRQQALCDRHAKLFEEPEDASNRSFFSEIITSLSDVKFSHSGKYILSRDYLTLKVWDVAMESRPVETYNVHEYFRSKLCTLYENDCIFDKFECAWSPDDQQLLTGSYNSFFRLYDRRSQADLTFEACRENAVYGAPLNSKRIAPAGRRVRPGEIAADSMDCNKKILHIAWHPHDDVLAIAATNNLYTFCARCPVGAPCTSALPNAAADANGLRRSIAN